MRPSFLLYILVVIIVVMPHPHLTLAHVNIGLYRGARFQVHLPYRFVRMFI